MTEAQPRPGWTLLCVVAGSLVALYATLKWMAVVHVGDVYLPVSHDSFYHARRILDAVADPSAYYQFDASIHVPEGSWLTWPWAYDWLLAQLTRLGQWLSGALDPMAVLVVIPPLASIINVALVAGIGRRIGLAPLLQLLAVLCYALLPLTQGLHGVGILDHHYVEQTFVLLTLYLGLAWFASGLRPRYGVLLGVALGAATAFHNSLFILQLPVLLTATVLWLRGSAQLAGSRVALFSLSLLLSTIVFLLPSEPFRQGYSAYYLHSWFHLYVAACTALVMAYFARWRFSPRTLVILLLLGLLMLAGMGQQLGSGMSYVSSDIAEWKNIAETETVVSYLHQHGMASLASVYTWLVVLLPVIVLWYVVRLFRSRDAGELFFAVMVVFGSGLLLAQWRMHYFGSFALFLPVLLLAQYLSMARPRGRWVTYAAVLLVVAVAYLPAYERLMSSPLITRSYEYGLTRSIFVEMHKACAAEPGVILAGHNDGHYISFHSDCPVIANNFIISPLHSQKVRQSERLLAGTAASLVANEPWIRYVYVNRMDNVLVNEPDAVVRAANAGLREELLLNPGAFPAGFTLLAEVQIAVRPDSPPLPLARLFRIDREAPPTDR